MATTRPTFTLDESLAQQARSLGIDVASAARDGVAAAVRAALAEADRRTYQDHPEPVDESWTCAEGWCDY